MSKLRDLRPNSDGLIHGTGMAMSGPEGEFIVVAKNAAVLQRVFQRLNPRRKFDRKITEPLQLRRDPRAPRPTL